MANKTDFAEQLEEIKAAASKAGAETNIFYLTTLDRYIMQINLLGELKKAIRENGTYISKEYVKGRQTMSINPAITEYNKTATAANNTVMTLTRIVKSLEMNTIMDVDAEDEEL